MQPIVTRVEGTSRASVELKGAPLWFESPDCDLTPSAEAFAGLALVPAAHHRDHIRLDAPLSPVWLASVTGILDVHHEWWGTATELPFEVAPAATEPAARSEVAALFSGGVDSFHTLLRSPYPIAALVFVQGFDMPLGDDERALDFLPIFRRIAASLGLRSIFVRTNVREHPYFNSVSWERSHGAALAAIGHLLASEYGKLIIPSSSTLDDVGLWGSHWRTDPLWQSGRVSFVHWDPAIHRNDKITMIAHEPLAHDSLRVCWENRAARGNCSACEKCVKTMVLLEACGQLRNFAVFDHSLPLSRRLDDLPRAPLHMIHVWGHVLERDLPEDVKDAIRRLILRSRWALRVDAMRGALQRVRGLVPTLLRRRPGERRASS